MGGISSGLPHAEPPLGTLGLWIRLSSQAGNDQLSDHPFV